MRIFAISDLHLSFQVDKPMDIFGPAWQGHPERIKKAWIESVGTDDIVLIPGDKVDEIAISEEVKTDERTENEG